MGKKTDKKIKLDRVNVLRKQYDAFLEEDKKRKDRNDYILGRLDKMRYSSTAVQPRHTPSMYRDHIAPSYDCHTNRPENLERNDMQMVHVYQHITRPNYNMQLDIPRNYADESSILKEISKKYILIPKLRSTFPNIGLETMPSPVPAPIPVSVSSEKPCDIDNNDWKSKYDILEQLKKKEREEEVKLANNDEHLDSKASTPKNNLGRANGNDHVMQNYIRDELPTRYEEEIPEKDVSGDFGLENELKSLEKLSINDNIDQIPNTDVAQTPSSLSLNPESSAPYYDQTKNDVYEQSDISTRIQENVEHYTEPEHYVVPAEQNIEAISNTDHEQYEQNYPEQEYQPQQEQPYPIEYEQFVPSTEADTNLLHHEKVVNQEENDYNPIEVINPSELVDEINKDIGEQEAVVSETAYPNEIAESQDFTPSEVTLQDGQDINPENYMSEDGTVVEGNPVPQMSNDDPIDNSGIEEFDAEQREMFYSEQANENYTYDNQGAAGGAYDQEYAQNQNYQAQDYAYYEGAQQEVGAYPAEINEHEETQQLYDQQYEQQYANANYEQGYEQQAVYMEQDPNQQQFEQPALYDQAQQEFEQYNVHPQPAETQELVEQVLDQEDGYIAKGVEDPIAQDDNKAAELNVP